MTTHKATTSKNPTSATTGDRLSVRIAHDLGVAITAGEYQPGDKLEGEIEVSDRLNVSRTAYREAIRMLTAKGMVESRPRTGRRPSRWPKQSRTVRRRPEETTRTVCTGHEYRVG